MRFVNAADLDKPAMVTLEAPFCDGSHEGSGITPLKFEADGKTPMAMCMCGLSKKPPHCDGSHRDY
jgi:CDGSH-type Zn-finger protein